VGLSVILPTKDEEKTIGRCLNGIFSQFFSKIECIIVDGYSKDRTVKIAESFAAQYPVKIYQMEGNIGEARDYAVKMASGDIIFSTDADAVIKRKDHFCKIVSDLKDKEVAVWTGIVRDPDFYITVPVAGANMAFRKRDYESVGGFPPYSTAEDVILFSRLQKLGRWIMRSDYEVIMPTNIFKWIGNWFSFFVLRN